MKFPACLAALFVFGHANIGFAEPVTSSVATRFANRETTAVPDFQKHVVPLLGQLGCNSAKCHGSFQGRGGLRLSLFGFDFRADHGALRAPATSAEGSRINLREPAESLMIAKPSEQIDHEGGQRFELGSWEHHLLLRWVESGAQGVAAGKAEPPAKSAPAPSAGAKLFAEKIQPLFETHCYECHGFNNRKGDFQLTRRDLLLQGGGSGPAVVPGKPDRSLLLRAVGYGDEELQMPPSGKLKAAEIADLRRWVALGAPWVKQPRTAADTGRVLVRLHHEPREILFRDQGDKVRLRVIAEWEDGAREDVTCLTRFRSNHDAVVSVNRDGLAQSLGVGDTHVVAFYDNGVASIPVLRPYRAQPTAKTAKRDARPHQNPIDKWVAEKLDKLGIVSSRVCTDAEFLRRVSIDMTGTLPTPNEVSAFLTDRRSDKRLRKIDELLDRPTYAAWWSNKLCDFTGCNPASIRSLLEVAVEEGYRRASEWYDWIYERVDANRPYDELVAGIMLADLSRGGDGEGMPHFWTRQSLKEPKDTAMSVAHSFLGIQLQCAECHKHPFDRWTQSDFQQFAQFFDSIVRQKGRARSQPPQQLRLLRSHTVSLARGDDPRQPIMKWMRDKENPWFARAFVNRVWAGYFHVGIVDPPDQFTPANPPSNPRLLDWLTQEFVRRKYNMKWLHRQIATSMTYQRSWKPNDTNRHDRRNFSRAIPRRIPAEVLYDAMKQVTAATSDMERVRTNLRRRASGHLSMRMAGTHAMKVFGKPDRAINCDCERVNEPTLLQAVFLQNDPLVRMRLAESNWVGEIEDAVKQGQTMGRQQLCEQVWLRTVNRPPRAAEVARANQHFRSVASVPEAVTDLLWALINTKEFLLNH